jgi:hypothetical protein
MATLVTTRTGSDPSGSNARANSRASRCSAKPIAPWVSLIRHESGKARPANRTATTTA